MAKKNFLVEVIHQKEAVGKKAYPIKNLHQLAKPFTGYLLFPDTGHG